MAQIHRQADTFAKQVRRRNRSNRAFLHGLISGFVAAAILFVLCFCLLGPVIYGSKPSEEQGSSQAESDSISPEHASECSSEPSSEPASAPVSEPVSEASSPSEAPSKAVSEAPSEAEKEPSAQHSNVEADRKPSGNDLMNSSYLEDSVFIGDSITQGLGLYLPDLNATVLGVRSLNPDSLYTVTVKGPKGAKMTIPKATVAYKPKVVYMMIGTNGLAFMSQSHMVAQLKQFIRLLRKELPSCRIVLESIPPVSRGKYNSDHRFSVKSIDSYNAKLKELAAEEKISFLDVNHLFRDQQGYLPTAETPDGIHFYKKNYLKWLSFILEDAEEYDRQIQSEEAAKQHQPALPETHQPQAA